MSKFVFRSLFLIYFVFPLKLILSMIQMEFLISLNFQTLMGAALLWLCDFVLNYQFS